MRSKLLAVVLALVTMFMPITMSAQSSNSLDYLRSAFPKLTNLYQNELMKYHAHYIFAIDVSGTMNQFSGAVTSSLRPFIQALPDGDRVDLIPFGKETYTSSTYSGIIDGQMRTSLSTNINNLYTDPTYNAGFKSCTDISKAIEAVSKAVTTNREYKVNIIVILTDFRNDDGKEHKFDQPALDAMKKQIDAATLDVYTRCIALQLPVDKNAPGYCEPQLKDNVFPQDVMQGNGCLELQPLGNNPSQAIGQWFEQLKREIMVTKLRAVIVNANKLNPARLIVKTNIDGKVMAEVHWTPSKLYPSMKIDSTYVKQQGFYFVNNKEAYNNTRDSVIGVDPELYLGQIRNESCGFHHFADSLYLGIDLPTEYDNELKALGVDKPIPQTTRAEDRWIFTFFMPFWLTATLLVLFILYIIGVIRAIRRNSKLKFNGSFTLYDADENQIGDKERLSGLSPSTVLSFGLRGNPSKCAVEGTEWSFIIEKKKGNPFLVFQKPYFAWKRDKGYAASGRAQSGKVGSMIKVRCGKSRDELTHVVKVQYIKQS